VKSVIVLLYQKVVPQRLCWSWNNIQINQSDLGDKFTIYVKFKLTTRVRWLYISVIIPKIRVKWYVKKLWVGLGLSLRVRNRVKSRQHCQKMMYHDQKDMSWQNHSELTTWSMCVSHHYLCHSHMGFMIV